VEHGIQLISDIWQYLLFASLFVFPEHFSEACIDFLGSGLIFFEVVLTTIRLQMFSILRMTLLGSGDADALIIPGEPVIPFVPFLSCMPFFLNF
jgi:hypothetical protein